jgi:hypothetical protein
MADVIEFNALWGAGPLAVASSFRFLEESSAGDASGWLRFLPAGVGAALLPFEVVMACCAGVYGL